MAKIKLEYIWLDGYKPTQNLRSKTKVEEHEDFQGTIEELGNWSRSERNKLLKLYLLMSHLRQVLALIGSFNDLNNDKAEFVHKFVGKETGFLDMKKMKESLINLRKYSSDLISKKLEDGWMKNE